MTQAKSHVRSGSSHHEVSAATGTAIAVPATNAVPTRRTAEACDSGTDAVRPCCAGVRLTGVDQPRDQQVEAAGSGDDRDEGPLVARHPVAEPSGDRSCARGREEEAE